MQKHQCFGDKEKSKNGEKLLDDELYVMLMLMRSAEEETAANCEDPMIKLACLDPELEVYKDCPASCRGDNTKEEDNTVVKSGDLAVSAKAAEGKKALIGGVSDLDTVTFKTSEDVTISSITLERYGYSTKEQVKSVQLEDEDGNIIADAKEPNSKGQVKLTLKKDYKTVDGTFKATIVLTTKDLDKDADSNTSNGSTIGFKVISAESTAKNLNLDDYTPYTYDLVNYKGSAVQFSTRNSATKDYNWEAGELYEVAKFRAKSPADATILVKGFTLTDSNKNKIEADKYAKDVIVTVNGKEVSGLKWNINKDDELVVSFSEVEVAAKETATFAVKMSFNEEFDNFGQSATYYIKQLSNFNAIDKKTETRVSEDATLSIANLATKLGVANGWTTYTFKGGKVKLSGTKLGTVNAAANSTNVKVAEGEITVTEALRGTATIAVVSNDIIDEIRLVIAGEEYDGSKVTTQIGTSKHLTGEICVNAAGTKVYRALAEVTGWGDGSKWEEIGVSAYTFKGLEIEKSGKVEVRVDVKDGENLGTMTFSSINSKSFDLKYDESGEEVGNQIVGSISVSNLKAQAAKASLDKGSSTEAELVLGETNRSTIFEGTYTAKNGAVTLKNFVITKVSGTPVEPAPTFYVTIGSEEYDADWSANQAKNDIDDIEVADGKSVNVKVEIDVVPNTENNGVIYNIKLEGEDEDNNKAGEADEDTVKVKVVKQGSIKVTDATAKKTILLKSNRDVAQFRIKPSKSGNEDVVLKTLSFGWFNDATATTATGLNELKIDIDGDKYTVGGANNIVTDGTLGSGSIYPDKTIPTEGVVVTVSLKSELDSEATGETMKRSFKLISINGNANVATTFSKYWVPAKIANLKQSKNGDTTRYTFDIDNDGSDAVSLMAFFTGDNTVTDTDDCTYNVAKTVAHKDTVSDTDNSMSAINGDKAASITRISYKVGNKCVIIEKAEFEDFFDLGSEDLMVYSNKSN